MRTTTESKEEPFWIHPPWSLLVDMTQKSENPWEINIAGILVGFLEKMRERELVDYKVSGKALLSASIIHRIKSELLLKLGQKQEEKKEKEDIDMHNKPIDHSFRPSNCECASEAS